MIRDLAAHHGDEMPLTLDQLDQEGRDWHRILVARADDNVVGYASLLPLGQLQFGVRGMDLHHLFVASEHRGEGIGSALIAASIGLSRALSCQYLTVGTHPDNKVAAQIYLKAGFDPLPNSGPRFRMRLDC